MRIISGTNRGRKLISPAGTEIRPTSDFVKTALFNMLPRMEGKRFLDAFAGSGGIGAEALSRGAAHVTFVDFSAAALETARKNIALINPDKRRYELILADTPKFLIQSREKYDIIYLDPPYRIGLAAESARIICERGLLAPDGVCVAEVFKDEAADFALNVTDTRVYGIKKLVFMELL
ncbi:MAG: 16S rRNA (guanine(966)-N(2))-methyltransferase RsmD [Firmicutes bacterium]|nr:16S rRNA (guanine(966)-N(2))-methyltransferase RsmD [Bacillota bacterium]